MKVIVKICTYHHWIPDSDADVGEVSINAKGQEGRVTMLMSHRWGTLGVHAQQQDAEE